MSTIILPTGGGGGGPVTVAPFITVAGRVFSDLTDLIILKGATANNPYSSCVKAGVGSTAGYQVTALKTLRIVAVEINTMGSGAVGAVEFLYGDTDVGFNSASAPTTPIFNLGSGGGSDLYTNAAPQIQVSYNYDWFIPAGKYPTIYIPFAFAGRECGVTLYGYEA